MFNPRGRVSWTDAGFFVSVSSASWRAETMQGPVLEDLYEGQDGVAVLPATGQNNPGRQCITPTTPDKPQKDSSHRIEPLPGWVLTGVLPSGQR